MLLQEIITQHDGKLINVARYKSQISQNVAKWPVAGGDVTSWKNS